jgi:transcriptional regulator GlxA family with amidase domain
MTKGTRTDRRMAWIVEFIQGHMAEPLTVPGLAALIQLSPSRFRNLFSTHNGMGPVQYVQRLRLARARLLLERTFLTIEEVMALVGYNDLGRFNREFRSVHGVEPAALRGHGVTMDLPASAVSSVESPVLRRRCQPRPREPGLLCA